MAMPHNIQQDTWKQMAGTRAAELVEDGMVVGLGTGSTANFMIYALANRLQRGLKIVGAVASSEVSADLASGLGIPIVTLDQYPELDIYIDGADELDDQLRLLKGAGGALVREKIVASCARRFIVIADTTKHVSQLGHRFPVPVETIPFAVTPVKRRLEALGATVQLRVRGDTSFISDNGNMILDCTFPDGIDDPATLNTRMHSIAGVVETGLFLNMAERAIIGGHDGVQTILATPRA